MNWLDELEELEKKATQGQWWHEPDPYPPDEEGRCYDVLRIPGRVRGLFPDEYDESYVRYEALPTRPTSQAAADIALIAAARNALPRLLRIARAAEALAKLGDIHLEAVTAQGREALTELYEAVGDE